MRNKKTIQLLLLLVVTITTRGQTIGNTGIMHINPGTIVGITRDFDNHETGTLWNDGELHLWSDFNNDGLVTFTAGGNGNTLFTGYLNQKIEGIGMSEFQNIVFNNGSAQPAFELHSEISVAGYANFSYGIVSNEFAGGLMVFEKDATHSNASDESHVDGNIKRNGGNEFIFPIGHKEFYRHSAIQATNDVLSSFTSNYFHENSDTKYPHANRAGVIEVINDQEYWTLENNNGTANAILILSWEEATTTPGIIASPEEDLHIVGWDPVQNLWIDQGGIVDIDNKTVTTPVSAVGYTVFTLARIKSSKIIQPCSSLVIYNAVSPNGDGMNDFFRIDGLETCSKGSNTVQIFNRWGVKVFETENYGENGNVFDGYSNAGAGISGNKALASGTYFYILNMNYTGSENKSQRIKKAGYLYLN